MRKIYLKRYEQRYGVFELSQNMNLDLDCLFDSFDLTNDWMRIDQDEGVVKIWNSWDMKGQKNKDFISEEEKNEYDNAYAKYWWKRWMEMPILEITEKNYEEVSRQWNKACQEKLKYLIVSIDVFGWVKIETKDELSQADRQDMQYEHQKFLEFRKKWDAYAPFTYKQNKEWQSREDEEYYSDFLTEEEMVWKKKKLK